MWKVKYVQQCFYLVNELYARTQYDERKECAAQCSLQDMNLMGSTHMVVLSSPKVEVLVVVDQLKRLKGSTTVLSGSSSYKD